MTLGEIQVMVDTKATVSLWPEAGEALGLTRGQTYRCAASGDIAVLEFGRLKRVPTAWLRQKLGINAAA